MGRNGNVRNQPPKQPPQKPLQVLMRVLLRYLQVDPIGVELGDSARCDHDASGEPVLDDV